MNHTMHVLDASDSLGKERSSGYRGKSWNGPHPVLL